MEANKRLQNLLNYTSLNVQKFAEVIGLPTKQILYDINKGKIKNFSENVVSKILDIYPEINRVWLLTGEGEMLKTSVRQVVDMDSKNGAPYYDVDFLGGFSEIFNDRTIVPASKVYIQGFEKADLWCNVTGHSMEPKISHGDIIGLHKCRVEDIQYGETYAVVMPEIRTVKILRKSTNPDMLRFVPVNKEEYDEQEFPRSSILHVFEVIGTVKRFF